ncbi:MAG: hypothetical protein R2855_12600 [Thermomicrobiales bacterium]
MLVSRWQDPRIDRGGNLSRSILTADRGFDAASEEMTNVWRKQSDDRREFDDPIAYRRS